MTSNYKYYDAELLDTVDLDDYFITDAELIDRFVGNEIWAWGSNSNGQLGQGNILNRSSPVQIGSLTNWKQVSASSTTTAAIKTDGTLWTWGNNLNGALGDGTILSKSSPIQVGAMTDWKQVSAGKGSTMAAIKTDGTLWAWGNNGSGQLGQSDITSRSSPIKVGTLTNWKQVEVGSSHIIAITINGTLWAWGSNSFGELGRFNSILPFSSPIQVGSLTNWKQVAAGSLHSLAIKTDGTLWTWGRNQSGQLGEGTILNRSSPIQIGSLTDWKQVSAGLTHTTAIKTDGTLWAWGSGSGAVGSGQLGDGSILDKSSPIKVGTLTNWKQVDAGFYNTTAIKTDGTLWAWGLNTNGQLGDGTIVRKSSPIQVGSLTNWKQVSAGDSYSTAVTYTEIS